MTHGPHAAPNLILQFQNLPSLPIYQFLKEIHSSWNPLGQNNNKSNKKRECTILASVQDNWAYKMTPQKFPFKI